MLIRGGGSTMLTKCLLKYKIKKGELFPEFVSPSSEGPYRLAQLLLNGLHQAIGLSLAELERRWDDLGAGLYGQSAGFRKILLDHVNWQDTDEHWPEERLALLLEAQKLRQETLFPAKEAFQETFSETNETTFPRLARQLYKDLPEERPLKTVPDFTPETLINRYNCALAQSLIQRSKGISLKLFHMKTEELRPLFQSLKFHQLVAEFEPGFEKGTELRLFIDGPLSILDSAQSYGIRLANFFPHILLCNRWEISAEVSSGQGGKTALLKLSNESGLKSHYRTHRAYIPEEFKDFCNRFNNESEDWKVCEGPGFLHIGGQSWCFPDLEFSHKNGEKILMELFHRWHKGPLSGRIRALKKNPARNLLLGVQRNLLKDRELLLLSEESEWFKQYSLFFRDFPTVKSVLSALGQQGYSC